MPAEGFTARLLASVDAIDAAVWDRLAGPAGPLLSSSWIRGAEATLPPTGRDRWQPAHLLLSEAGEPAALMPLWLRHDTWGEFVWYGPVEDAARQLGRPLAPRLVNTVPFTPANGLRVLTGAGDRPRLLAAAAAALAGCLGGDAVSAHVHFCADDEADAFAQAGFARRLTWQYQWRNDGYADLDAFLGVLGARRRNRWKRETRALVEQGVTVEVVRGDEAPDSLWEDLVSMYDATARRNGEPSAPLGWPFFEALRAGIPGDIRFFVARRGDELLGATFHALHGDVLYGRFWGCREDLPFLHFNLAYHAPVAWAIEQGLSRFEPGHGGEFKRRRGFRPALMSSMHLFGDRAFQAAVADWADREAGWVQQKVSELAERSGYRSPIFQEPPP